MEGFESLECLCRKAAVFVSNYIFHLVSLCPLQGFSFKSLGEGLVCKPNTCCHFHLTSTVPVRTCACWKWTHWSHPLPTSCACFAYRGNICPLWQMIHTIFRLNGTTTSPLCDCCCRRVYCYITVPVQNNPVESGRWLFDPLFYLWTPSVFATLWCHWWCDI